MDPRVEQLVVGTATIDSLLKQKLQYDHELELEQTRLERFKHECAQLSQIKTQTQVVKRVMSMMPKIVHKLKWELELFERFLRRNKELELVCSDVYKKAERMVHMTKENLERTT